MKADSTQTSTVAILLPSGGNSNVRDVTVIANGTQATWGIRNVSLASAKIEGATIITTASGSQDGYGISSKLSGSALTVKRTVISVSGGTGKRYGISAFSTAALSKIRDVQINVGVYTDSFSTSATSIFNSSITATRFGVEHSGNVLVDNCVIAGGDASVVANGGGIGATRLDGSAFGPTCAGVYDASFTFYSSTCP